MFFYNRDTRAAGSGRLDASGNYQHLHGFPDGQFGEWTHIVDVGGMLFFYNREKRAASSGKLDASGNYQHLHGFPDGQFGEWTHIVAH